MINNKKLLKYFVIKKIKNITVNSNKYFNK